MSREHELDLGMDHWLRFADWDPDVALNPQVAHLAGQFPARVSAIIRHGDCEGAIMFDTPIAREHFSGPYWQVESWEPLTLSPSLLCQCGDHGFIKQGKWTLS